MPFDTNTRAIGWVDLDCHIIEEKDWEARAEDECREIVRFEMKTLNIAVEEEPTPESTKKQTSVPSKETMLMPEWIRLVIFILVPLGALGVWILLTLRHRRRVSGL